MFFFGSYADKVEKSRITRFFNFTTQVGLSSSEDLKMIQFAPVTDHFISIKGEHFEIFATEKSHLHCKIKETLLVSD